MGIVDVGQRFVRDLEQGMHRAQRRQPLLAGRLLETVSQLLGGLAGQRRRVGVIRRPPAVGGDVDDEVAQGCRVGWEEQNLGNCRELRLEALLGGLLPEGVEVRRERHVRVQLGVLVLESVDHRAVVGGAVRICAAVDRCVSGSLDQRYEVGPKGSAVGVVRIHLGDDLVGAHLRPHREKAAGELVKAEEEHRRELECVAGLGAAAEVPGLPRHYGGHAGYAAGLAERGHRVGDLGG